jgi:hypothetical protein
MTRAMLGRATCKTKTMVHISVGAEDLAACIRNVHPLALPTSEGGT